MIDRSPRILMLAALALPLTVVGAAADKIRNPTAIFAGLDKITGRITSFEVAIDETVQFGTLQLTPRVCYTRPVTEAPNTTAFIEVDEVAGPGRSRRIFGGWVFAASPGLHAIEHAVYDMWLTGCKGGTRPVSEETPAAAAKPAPPRQGQQPGQGQGQGTRPQQTAPQPAARTPQSAPPVPPRNVAPADPNRPPR